MLPDNQSPANDTDGQVDNQERTFIKMAIEEARKSVSEDQREHPKVGAVVVKQGRVLAVAHRGEIPSCHAEFVVLEEKLGNDALAGSVLYTTLEPCTTRNHPKVACAERIRERRFDRVVIGMLDPNPKIHGDGFDLLRDAGVAVEMFPRDLMSEVEELNRNFTRQFRRERKSTDQASSKFVRVNRSRDLDEWYRAVNVIYWNRNFQRDSMSIFTHLVEVVGGLSLLASQKKKRDVTPETFVPKAIAWWLVLCAKVGVKSVGDMVWSKFPNACAYCHKRPHDPDECSERKAARPGPDWERLGRLGDERAGERPTSLSEWQRMFSAIYPAQQTEDFGPSFGRLSEELGELAEALRVFPAAPGYFLSEAADVFAWLMHIQNIVDQKKGTPKAERGRHFEEAVCLAYPDHCLDCGQPVCDCPPILESTIGRIAHEVPTGRGSFDSNGSFLTPDKVLARFQPNR
jgi:pyrimidine deaminase RibD-like protein/NTP pyrophosphatase (non-canonical NTP hydrolase)